MMKDVTGQLLEIQIFGRIVFNLTPAIYGIHSSQTDRRPEIRPSYLFLRFCEFEDCRLSCSEIGCMMVGLCAAKFTPGSLRFRHVPFWIVLILEFVW